MSLKLIATLSQYQMNVSDKLFVDGAVKPPHVSKEVHYLQWNHVDLDTLSLVQVELASDEQEKLNYYIHKIK
jgi:hypothetical protein